jgi:membrane protease YdiL (CAAX protease family)
MKARQRTAALLEVFGIYLAGQLVTGLLIRLLGLRPANPLTSLTVGVTDAELITATGQLFVLLVLQYAGWFLLIIPINWWHRRRGPVAYGLTRAGHSWNALLLAGLGTAALCVWPTILVGIINSFHPLGETVPWRQAIFDTSWRRWEFWLFTGVLSWGFVAVVEEIFFRGYCQRRLAEDWGDGPAIAAITCLFIFSHTQYLAPNAYNAAMITTLLLAATGSGVVFAWTRSLVPSIVAHAISNVPMTLFWQVLIVATLVVGAMLISRRGATVARHVFSNAKVVWCVILGTAGTAYAIASARVGNLVHVAVAMVVLAVIMEAVERRRERTAAASITIDVG